MDLDTARADALSSAEVATAGDADPGEGFGFGLGYGSRVEATLDVARAKTAECWLE